MENIVPPWVDVMSLDDHIILAIVYQWLDRMRNLNTISMQQLVNSIGSFEHYP